MFESDEEILNECLADRFAAFFDNKIKKVLGDTKIDENVYNGTQKVNAENSFFMDRDSIEECIRSLSIKNSEGFDRIPQRVIVDG